jgi:hypothetical protein
VATINAHHPPNSTFAVRMLKYGTCEVVLKRDVETPPMHIRDFASRDEAQAWIRENAGVWVVRRADKT